MATSSLTLAPSPHPAAYAGLRAEILQPLRRLCGIP